MSLFLAFLLLLFAPLSVSASPADFSQDSAFAVLRVISMDIGPRPMGSPAEQRAMQFAVDRFRAYGCSDAYVMPMTVAEGVNTKSGIAIGILKGRTDRIVIIGGHIDSAGPDVPGANDDGSGTACVLELARVLCKSQHESTLMFCCWGGEEQGLQGSKYFVSHFRSIDSVALMIQIDMADGASYLEIDPDYRQISSPRWLTKAAYEIFFDELHERGLFYPVASAALNTATGGTTGSDHDPFLEKGIPAIDFTSDVDYPIHTPQDNLANFTPSGLKKTGDLVLRLVERFDKGVPHPFTEKYMLFQVGIKTVFLDPWMLWVIVALSLLLSLAAILVLRGRSRMKQGIPGARMSGSKLLFSTLAIQAFIWESETSLGWISGYRFPWVNHFAGIVVLGMFWGALGLWLMLNVIRRFRLSKDACVYGWRALLMLVIMTILSALGGPKLATFLACATIFMSLAILVRATSVRLLFWILSLLTMSRLIFFEELGLFQRELTQNTVSSFWGLIGYEFLFVFVYTLLALPFVYGFAAIYRDSGKDLLWLRRFRERGGLAIVLPAIALVTVYLVMHPPYGPEWYGRIVARQDCTSGMDSCSITLHSSEYLEGLTMTADTGRITYDDRANAFEFFSRQRHAQALCVIQAQFSPELDARGKDSVWKTTRLVTIHSAVRPYKVEVRYSSGEPLVLSSPWAYRRAGQFEKRSDRAGVFSWYSFPDTLLEIPVTFSLRDTQRVSERIEVTFDTLAYPMHLEKDLTNFEKRTVIKESHEFGASDSAPVAVRQP